MANRDELDQLDKKLDVLADDIARMAVERDIPLGAIILLAVGPDGHLRSNIMERLGGSTLQSALAELMMEPGTHYVTRNIK